MNRVFLSAISTFALTGLAAAIDLTPRYSTTATDAISGRRPYFADNDKRYSITLDAETELTAYGDSALFNFTKFPGAAMRLSNSSLKPGLSFEEVNLLRYRDAATRLLVNASNIVLDHTGPGDPLLNGWTSYCFTFSYDVVEVRMTETVMFFNLDAKQQLVLQIRARAPEFQVVSLRGLDMIRRWHEIQPGEEQGLN